MECVLYVVANCILRKKIFDFYTKNKTLGHVKYREATILVSNVTAKFQKFLTNDPQKIRRHDLGNSSHIQNNFHNTICIRTAILLYIYYSVVIFSKVPSFIEC